MGAGFGGTLKYVLDGDGRNQKEVRVLAYEGVDVKLDDKGQPIPDAMEVARSFRLQTMLNQEVDKPVIHVSLSWPPEDAPRLTDAEMVSAAKEYLQRMGWTNTQYFIARHLEKDNPHIHIVLNKVDNNGKRLNDSFCKRKNVTVCREITEERHYTLGRSKMISTARDISDPREDCRYRISQEILHAVAKVTDIRQLPKELAKQGIVCTIKEDSKGIPRGISFSAVGKDGLEYHFSGAQVDRKFTTANLCKAIALKEKMPAVLKEAEWLDKLYRRASPLYDIPKEVRAQCRELNAQLRTLEREESRLEHDKSSIRSSAVRSAFFAILSGNVVEALMVALISSLAIAIRDGRIKAVREARLSLEAREIRLDTRLRYPERPMQSAPRMAPEENLSVRSNNQGRNVTVNNEESQERSLSWGPRL